MSVQVTPAKARMGWLDRPRDVAKVVNQLPMPIFAMGAGPGVLGTEHRDVFFWEQGEQALLNKILPAHRQTIGDCLHPDSIVIGDEIKRIADVNVGDVIFDGHGDRCNVISKVQKIVNRPLLEIRCLGSLSLKPTPEHKIMAIRTKSHGGRPATPSRLEVIDRMGLKSTRLETLIAETEIEWYLAGDLQVGDYLVHPINKQVECNVDEEWMYVYGLFLANGHASVGSVEWTGKKDARSLELLCIELNRLGVKFTTSDYKGRNASRVRLHSKELVTWFRREFYAEDGSKKFPGWAIGNQAFIDGLLDGDGHKAGNAICLTSTSLSVIHGAEASLAMLGHRPVTANHPRGKTFDNAKPLYHCQFVRNPKKKYGQLWNGFYCRRITSIDTLEGPHEVYDIGVDSKRHSFIANGISLSNCVSHAYGRGAQDVVYMTVAGHLKTLPPEEQPSFIKAFCSLFGQDVEDPTLEIATEPIYAGSRVEIGGGRIRGDGSVGAWAADFVNKFGLLQRKKYDQYDLTKYSGAKAKEWGAPRAGVPDILEPIAKLYPIQTVSLVVTDDEASAALYNMYPIPVCSGQGFRETRDKYGFCDPFGSWSHAMECRGICIAKRGSNWVLAVVIQQSWGGSPSGPNKVELKDGRIVELPQGCFLIEMDVFVRMLRGRDSFALSDVKGFVQRMPNFTL